MLDSVHLALRPTAALWREGGWGALCPGGVVIGGRGEVLKYLRGCTGGGAASTGESSAKEQRWSSIRLDWNLEERGARSEEGNFQIGSNCSNLCYTRCQKSFI